MEASFPEVYQEKISIHKATLKDYASGAVWLSVLRFSSFGGFVWMLVTGFRSGFSTIITLSVFVSLIIFFALVAAAINLNRKKKLVQHLLRINENEVTVHNGGSSFLDDGSAVKPQQGFTTDLTVFGHHSLFHLLNRTGSLSGRQKLVQHLSSPFIEPGDIIRYQQCVQELRNRIDFRQALLAQCLIMENETGLAQLLQGADEKDMQSLQNPLIRLLSVGWPVLGITSVIYAVWSGNYRWMLLVLLLGLVISGLLIKKINNLYNHISRKGYLYTQYARCFRLIGEQNFAHQYLVQKTRSVAEAQLAFKSLSSLISWFDMRLNLLLMPFTNGLFLSDLLCAKSYIRWNRRYGAQVPHWFETLGEMELLNSLAGWHFNHPHFVFAVPVSGSFEIRGTGIGHPLMKKDKAVLNDIQIGEPSQLHLITGSNMSGKSTYLRTIGLNMLLAQTGAPVFAGTFVFTPVRMLTSFHHIDSLEESTSYFYAELKCLQQIILSLETGAPSLVLLDEVMRGTNSQDKHDGTALLIRKLLQHGCLTLVATHDTELGILADTFPGKIENYCFESELTDTGLHFDFKRRTGVAQTKNATYLMQQMGII